MEHCEKETILLLQLTARFFALFFDAANVLKSIHRSSRIDRRTDRTTMLLVAVLLLFLITEFPQGILGLLSGIMGKWYALNRQEHRTEKIEVVIISPSTAF